VTYSERAMTTTVNDIEHMESQSMFGVGVIKVFFHPHANISAAVGQVTSISQTILRVLPPGIQPPLIVQYSASNVPIVQIAASSPTLTEAQLYDYGLNFIRTQLDNERSAVQILRGRFVSSVLLVKALGGGWTRGGSSQ